MGRGHPCTAEVACFGVTCAAGRKIELIQLLLRQAAETGAARNELLDRRGDRASDAAARRQQRRAGSGAHRIGENLQGARSCGAGR